MIGIVAGLLVCYGVWFFDHVAHVDDPCGAISVHGLCGAWGVLAVGIFADGTYGSGWNGVSGNVKGLLYGDGGQLLAQVAHVVVGFVWALGVTCLDLRCREAVHADPGVPRGRAAKVSTCPSSAPSAIRTSCS